MKKTTLTFLALLTYLCSYAQFPETFAGPNSLPTTWAVFDNGVGTTESWQQSENGFALVIWEAVAAGETAEDWLVSPSYNVNVNTPLLVFEATPLTDPDYGSTLSLRIQVDEGINSDRQDPSLYTTVETFTELDLLPASSFNSVEIDLSAYAGQDVFIAFVYSNNDGDAWALRNADFTAIASTAPQAAINPNPVDGSTVFLSQGTDQNGDPVNQYEFTWETPIGSEDATSFLFDLGVDNSVSNFSTNLSAPNLILNGLAFDTTYYWRITSQNNAGSTVGSVWSFTTESTLSNTEIEAEKILEHFVSNNTLSIKANNQIDHVEIYNMLGQAVHTVQPKSNSSNIALNTLSSGMFIAKVTIEGQTQTFKFVK